MCPNYISQARQDLDKMRYSKTKAENEKLKEEKAEMEQNLLKLQQQLKDAKTRQEGKKANSKPTSPTHTPSSPASKAPKSDENNSSKDYPDSRTERTTPDTSNQSAVHKPVSKPEAGGDGTKYQPNQNSNARTGDAKSINDNKSTNETSANKAVTSATARATVLPDGWEKRWDEKSKRYFYLNHKQNTTQWEPPGEKSQKPETAEAKRASSNAALSSKAVGKEATGHFFPPVIYIYQCYLPQSHLHIKLSHFNSIN